jgi:hypothetical protein
VSARPKRRDPFAEVGAATRQAIETAMPDLTLPEARVLLVIVARLTSWSLLADRIAMRQIAEATGMDDRAVRRAVSSLAARGVIGRAVGGSAPAEGRRASLFELPTPGQVTPGSLDPGSADPGSVEVVTPGQVDPQTPGRGDHLHENYPRTVREVTPQPPAQRGASTRRNGGSPRANGTNPRARALGDEVAAQRTAAAEAESRTRTAGQTGQFRPPPADALAAARDLIAHPRAERPA